MSTRIEKLLEPLRSEIETAQAALDRAMVGLDLLQHDLEDPVEPEPTPEPGPEQPGFTAKIQSIRPDGRVATIMNSPEARQALPKGTRVTLPDGVERTVEWAEESGGAKTFLNLHLNGQRLDTSMTGDVRVAGGSEPEPKPDQPVPELPPNPGKLPDLSFDMPIPGVNIAGPDFRPNAYWPTEEDYELAASKGIKGIRQPFRWDIVQPQMNGPVDLTNILRCLDWAAKRGQRVVIDMHDYMRRSGSKSPLIGSSEVPQSAYNDAWVKIAKGVMGHPGLAGYGLMNEPNGTGGTWHKVAKEVIEAIRTVDRQTLRFIAGDGWGNARNFPEMNPHFPLDDPDGLNVYEAHSYDDKDHSGVWPNRNEVVDVNIGVNCLRPFVEWCRKHGVRGYIGEIGGFGTSQLSNESMLTGEPAKAATESAKRALAYLADNHIPFAWWAAGGHWGNSLNAIQIGGRGANRQHREPISLITAHAGKVTRRMRPE